ncbi:MAG: hypothetical protein HY332_24600 [Chloroflexi bacterium]|nr:hypothetical protein [Chloroflexota bacterium]
MPGQRVQRQPATEPRVPALAAADSRAGVAPGMAQRASFMLRLWHEPGDGWRGQVTHVQTGATAFFRNQPQLWRFVRTCLRLEPGDPLFAPSAAEPE